jgi:hypothetical protein
MDEHDRMRRPTAAKEEVGEEGNNKLDTSDELDNSDNSEDNNSDNNSDNISDNNSNNNSDNNSDNSTFGTFESDGLTYAITNAGFIFLVVNHSDSAMSDSSSSYMCESDREEILWWKEEMVKDFGCLRWCPSSESLT